MGGLGAFLAKEFMEIPRTWRLWVVPAIVIFMGVTSPILAQLTPALVKSVGQGQPGFVIKVPDPTTMDAYLQWTKNLSQIVLIAVIIVAGGLVVSERKSGTAVIVLTKPVSRSGFILAKTISESVLVAAAAAVGGLLCWATTLAVFGEAPLAGLVEITALWVLFAWMFVGLMVLLSVLVNSQAGAAGIGLVVYLVLSTLGGWGPARPYSPAGILSAMGAVPAGDSPQLTGPVLTTILATAMCVALAIAVFRRQEL